MTLPIVRLSGSPHEQGVVHGRTLRDRIAHNLDIYFTRFAREAALPRPAVLEIAAKWLDAADRQNPDYTAGLRGVAEGSGFPVGEIAALNARYEILYYQFGKLALAAAALVPGMQPEPDGCTAFALLPEATVNGHLLMGQNWDWIPEVQGAVLHTTDADGFQTMAYTESGIVGAKVGLNSAGIGLAINGMTTTNDDWSRLRKPFHIRCYEILRSRDFESAVKVVTGEDRSCSTNFLIAQAPGSVVDIEAAPETYTLRMAEGGCLTHANHFVDATGSGVVEPPNERRIYSCHRQDRLRELLTAGLPQSVEKIQDALRDTVDDPFGVCRHRDLRVPPAQHYVTVTSVVMDLDTRTLHLTDGPPDESPYQTLTLD